MDYKDIDNTDNIDNTWLDERSEKELRALKLWLFSENVRVENEKRKVQELQNKFLKERTQFQNEMRLLNQSIASAQQRLKQDQNFFDKKMEILQNGFYQLDEDRKKFEREQKMFRLEKEAAETFSNKMHALDADILFAGVDNIIALKKRYRDLLKIFHPDNLAGDREAVLYINREYERRRDEYAG